MQSPRIDRHRASRLMEAAGIDVLLVTSKRNAAYISGFLKPGGYSFEADMYGRPDVVFVALPGDLTQEPFMVLHTDNKLELHGDHDSWIRDRRFYGFKDYLTDKPLQSDPANLMMQALREAKLDRAVIGVELQSAAHTLDLIPADLLHRLQQKLPGATFLDASMVLSRLRMVKSVTEIQALKKAARSAAGAMEAALADLGVGDTEQSLERRLAQEAIARGAQIECVHLMYLPSKRRFAGGQLVLHPTANKLQAADMIFLDLVGRAGLYMADMSRSKFQRQPRGKIAHLYDVLREANEELRRRIRPGVTCAKIARVAQQRFNHAGLKPFIQDVFGHGLGVGLHEAPFLRSTDKTRLEPGMVLTVELGTFASEPGFLHLEDTVVVTPNGCETLTPVPTREPMLR